MEPRYSPPSPTQIMTFYNNEIKGHPNKTSVVVGLSINFFNQLAAVKPPEDANRLLLAALIWHNETDNYQFLSKEALDRVLGFRPGNQLDDKFKACSLIELAVFVNKTEMKLTNGESKQELTVDSNSTANRIANTALLILEKISLRKFPHSLFESFRLIPGRYNGENLSLWRKLKKTVSDYSAERTIQTTVIETASNLFDTLRKNGETSFDYATILMAISYYLMYDLERECSTRQPTSKLYSYLAAFAKIKHSSEISAETQHLCFYALYQLIKKTTPEQWEAAKPKRIDTEQFNIASYIYTDMRTAIPQLQLCANPPRSLASAAISGIGSVIPTTLSYAQSFALAAFANELYAIRGIGKNSIIIKLATHIGECLAFYAGSLGGYVIQKSAQVVGEAAEKRIMTYSIMGILRVTIGYLATKELSEKTVASVYNSTADPFEALIKLALIHTKNNFLDNKDIKTEDCHFFESLLSLYTILPKHVKDQLNASVQKKREADAALVLTETKEILKSDIPLSTPDAAVAQAIAPEKKGPPPAAASSVSLLKAKSAIPSTPSPAPTKREALKVR